MSLARLLLTDPDRFMTELQKNPDHLSLEVAEQLDKEDPLNYTSDMFEIDKLIPFAGHSLGPVFKPVPEAIKDLTELQKQLHAGHFPGSHPKGEKNGNWFNCDREKDSLLGAKQILGFKEFHEFNPTASGLSQNLATLMDTFYPHITTAEWQSGKSKIIMLSTEFFSDRAVAASVVKRATTVAALHDCFVKEVEEKTPEGGVIKKKIKMQAPTPESEVIEIVADDKGLYCTQDIIDVIRRNADKTKMICLPDIVFNTGQRLELNKIFAQLDDVIKKHDIKIILDLAHTVGNRAIDLESMPVTAAVGCGYKHLSGYAGSAFGIYVNRNVDLNKYPPLQGWTALDAKLAFENINSYNHALMTRKSGAIAFSTSNPPPLALLPMQTYLSEFGKIGFDKCFIKSECLTRYLIMQLQHHLGDKIEIITPLDPKQRGATIAIRVKDGMNVVEVEEKLKKAGFEIDSRPPNILRMTAHYGYTKFADINRFVLSLKKVLDKKSEYKDALYKKWSVMALAGGLAAAFSFFAVSKATSSANESAEAPKLTLK